MDEPVLVVSNGGHRCLVVATVAVHSVTGKACLAHSMQLPLEGCRHVCCIAERQLVASQQQGVYNS